MGDFFRATFDNPEQNTFCVFRTRALRKIAESVAAGKENPSFPPTDATKCAVGRHTWPVVVAPQAWQYLLRRLP
jgi:hypothetical protein